MNLQYVSQKRRKVIEDVYAPDDAYRRNKHVGNYLNTAIGDLAQRWDIHKRLSRKKTGYLSTDAVVKSEHKPAPVAPPAGYTVIQPLPTWERHPQEPVSYSRAAFMKLHGAYAFVRSMLDSIYARMGRAWKRTLEMFSGMVLGVKWLPKNYSLARGQYTDWHRQTFVRAKKQGLPMIAALTAVMLVVLAWPIADFVSNGHHRSPTGQASAASGASSPDSSGKNSSKKNSSQASTPAATTAPAASATSSPASRASNAGLNLTGGRGGGSTAIPSTSNVGTPIQDIVPAAPTPSPVPIPQPPDPAPSGDITIPGQSVPSTDPLLQTPPVTVNVPIL